MEKNIVLKAHAKVNLTLEVLFEREDGYHELRSVMHSIGISDTVAVSAFRLTGGEERVTVACDEELPLMNTARKAAEAYFVAAGEAALGFGARISIKKGIPSEAGMGGASADGAAVLRALDLIFGAVDEKTLYSLGKSVGADVPFCLLGGCALCEGIGERLTPLPAQKLALLIVKGSRGVSTGALFRSLDAAGFTERGDRSLPLELAFDLKENEKPRAIAARLMNDLAPAAERVCPEIGEYRERLLASGALGAQMTGSGSSVFGIFETEEAALKAKSRFTDCFCSVTSTEAAPFELI